MRDSFWVREKNKQKPSCEYVVDEIGPSKSSVKHS